MMGPDQTLTGFAKPRMYCAKNPVTLPNTRLINEQTVAQNAKRVTTNVKGVQR